MLFSERYSLHEKKALIINDISDSIRNRVWNVFYANEIKAGGLKSSRIQMAVNGEITVLDRVVDRIGMTIDSSSLRQSSDKRLREYLLSGCKWYEVYDFIEIYLGFLPKETAVQRAKEFNKMFEEEKSGYRIVCMEVAPITNEAEIESIEQAASSPLESVNQHIKNAVSLYSDKVNPDYNNTIKEAISAVESVCCNIVGKKTTLSDAIKKLKDNGVEIHPALVKAFDALYGYTSDKSGIRHGSIDFKNAPAEDALYMLVSCSAFVNYLIEKWEGMKKPSSKMNSKTEDKNK